MASQILGGKLEALSKQFRYFSEKVYPGSSPLYQQLAARIAEDHEILTLASEARKGELVPNLFFGAIHFLLLQGANHPLSAFFPSVSHSSSTDDDPYPYFRSFSLENDKRIGHLLSSRRVQTNEVQRCACLLPAFGLVARESPRRPLSIVDIGASAGLNLLWDRYGYDYGTGGGKHGDPNSPVQISCALRGELRPPIPEILPPVESRVGIDLNPIDVRNPEETLWLRSLVWPEHTRRGELLQRAIGLAKQEPPRVVAGDVLDVLPDVLSGLPGETTICLFHSHTVYQFPQELRDRLSSLVVEHSRNRNVFEVSFEWWRGKDQPLLELSRVHDGIKEEEVLAYCNPHGEWLQWTRRDHP